MITTRPVPAHDASLDSWLVVDPDVYLDARQPAWEPDELAGQVRFTRESGERRGRLRVAPAAIEIHRALSGPAPRRVT